MTAAHGQFAKNRRIDGIGRDDDDVRPPAVRTVDGQHQQPLGPLRRADNAPLKPRAPAPIERGDCLARQFEQRRLPTLVPHETHAERSDDGHSQPKRIDLPEVRGGRGIGSPRANDDERERRKAYRDRAAQRDAPRPARFAIEACSLSQRTAALRCA